MNSLTSHQPFIHASNNDGFSLIEVLISILVLSFGIMGAVHMQLNAIQAAQQANFYSTAMELVTEITEKLRSNHHLQLTNFTDSLVVRFQADKANSTSTSICFAENCSSDQRANADMYEWAQHLNSTLPHAKAVICHDSSPWNSNTNSLTWDCTSSDNKTSIVIKLGWTDRHNADDSPPPRLAVAVTPYS